MVNLKLTVIIVHLLEDMMKVLFKILLSIVMFANIYNANGANNGDTFRNEVKGSVSIIEDIRNQEGLIGMCNYLSDRINSFQNIVNTYITQGEGDSDYCLRQGCILTVLILMAKDYANDDHGYSHTLRYMDALVKDTIRQLRNNIHP